MIIQTKTPMTCKLSQYIQIISLKSLNMFRDSEESYERYGYDRDDYEYRGSNSDDDEARFDHYDDFNRDDDDY